jgi:hypothetical protein
VHYLEMPEDTRISQKGTWFNKQAQTWIQTK